MRKFFITQHAQQRYVERVHNGLNVSPNLIREMLDILKTSTDITSNLIDKNPRFLLYLLEKYGKTNFIFLRKDKMLFILNKRKGTMNLFDVLTCYFGDEKLKMFENSSMKREEIFMKIKLLKKKLKII